MIIKQSLKLLDAPCFCGEDMPVLFIRQSYKVGIPIITPDSVKVMHYPTSRKWFVVSLLPYQDMLANIASFIRSRVFGKQHTNISPNLTPAPLPSKAASLAISSDLDSISTRFTMLRPIINKFTARALFSMTKATRFTLFQFLFTVRVVVISMVFFCIHKYIIPHNVMQVYGGKL